MRNNFSLCSKGVVFLLMAALVLLFAAPGAEPVNENDTLGCKKLV
ncbi:MAG: hypothetical protein HW380_3812 [Magnetococcales bacterium]|nr:hypothetical protein [Magnetococcales bacterium]